MLIRIGEDSEEDKIDTLLSLNEWRVVNVEWYENVIHCYNYIYECCSEELLVEERKDVDNEYTVWWRVVNEGGKTKY